MDLAPTDEQMLLSETARTFVARRANDCVSSPDTEWRTIVDLGWSELAMLELTLVVEQLGLGAVATPLPITGALRAALREELTASPEAIVTLAALVLGASSERAGPYPSPSPARGGGAALHGVYLVVPWAEDASVVVAGTEHGLVTFDPRSPGITVTHQDVLGDDPRYRLDCAGAPCTPIAGDLGRVIDHVAVAHLAYAVGAALGALNLSVQYARDRTQFGRPIGSFQAVAHRCADMRAEIDACRVLAQRAAWALDSCGDANEEVSVALGYAKDALRRVAMHAHQVHGAIGFSTEYPLHRFTRRTKEFELSYGSTGLYLDRFATAIGLEA